MHLLVHREEETVAETVIQEDLKIQGNLKTKDGVVSVAGKVTGDVDAKSVEVRAQGEVKGKIDADKVVISGRLEGSITCGELVLEQTSEIKADVRAGTMAMDPGAKISGRVEARGE